MPGGFSTSPEVQYFYDDENGTPVEITDFVLQSNDHDLEQVIENVTPFGSAPDVSVPTGRYRHSVIELSGVFLGAAANTPDHLFGGRVGTEGPDADTRTYKVTKYPADAEADPAIAERSRSVETHLISYRTSFNKENGLTRFTVRLQPTGDVTETGVFVAGS